MSELKKYKVDEPFVHINAVLGEGPYWEEDNNVIRWMDIEKRKLYEVDLDAGAFTNKNFATLDIPIGVTADVDHDAEKFMIAGKCGFGVFDKRWNTYKYIAELWKDDPDKEGKDKRYRLNDGAVDFQGRFWAGTMVDTFDLSEMKPEGTLFRMDSDLSLHRMEEGASVPNGISWTNDQKTMYWTDSMALSIFAYDFDAATGNISNKRVFWQTDGPEYGVPDGHAMDVEEHLWVALFNGSKVIRINPQGKVVAEIQLPTRAITCPVFAEKVLYITTAGELEPEKYPDSVKFGGSLFRCDVGIEGQKRRSFRADKPLLI